MAKARKITDFFPTAKLESDAFVEESDEDDHVQSEARRKSPTRGVSIPSSTTTSTNCSRTRKFVMSWLKTFPWLKYDNAENSMSCKLCTEFNQPGVWASTGTQNFRLKTIKSHLVSSSHKLATSASETNQDQLAENYRKAETARKEAFMVALKTAYWITAEEVANMKYASLIEFLQEIKTPGAEYLNKGKNASYKSSVIFIQLLDSLADVLKTKLKLEIKNSPFIAIGVDESTDRSNEQHVAIIVRYISPQGSVVTTFLRCHKIENGTALCVFDTVKAVLNEFEIPMSKVVGLGTDGASTMSSPQQGLNGLVTRETPFCVFIHCICHRLQLAASQASSKIQTMQALFKLVSSTYNFVQTSPKRLEKFQDIARILELDVVKFKRIFEIRWLSLAEALIAVLRNYEPLVVLLDKEAAEEDPVAVGLHMKLTSFKFLALLALTADALSVINHLSRLFQHNDICFSALGTQLQDCMTSLRDMKTQSGPYLSNVETGLVENPDGTGSYKGCIITIRPGRGEQWNQKDKFQEIRGQFLDNLLKNLEDRFPRVPLINPMQIFEPSAYPSETKLIGWGNSLLEVLLERYGEQKTNTDGKRFDRLVDPDGCRGEFLPFKRLVYSLKQQHQSETLRPTHLMFLIFNQSTGYKAIYPEMFRLMALSLCVLVGNAEAERVFSCQNRIKTKSRTRLTIDHLDQLIRISFNKICLQEMDFEKALNHFMRTVNRRL